MMYLVMAMYIIAGCNHRSTVLDKPPVVSRKPDMTKKLQVRQTSLNPVEPHRKIVDSLTVAKNEFTSSLKDTMEKGIWSSPPVDLSSGKFELVTHEIDAPPELLKACEDTMDKKLSDPSYVGEFTHGIWEQYETPEEGQTAAIYGVTSIVLPIDEGEGNLRCFAVNFAKPTSQGIKNPSNERSLNLFLRLDPVDSDTWETDPGDTKKDESDIAGESGLDIFKEWLKRRFTDHPMGVRWLEVLKSQAQTQADILRIIVISTPKAESN